MPSANVRKGASICNTISSSKSALGPLRLPKARQPQDWGLNVGPPHTNSLLLASGLVFDRPQILAIKFRLIPLPRNSHAFLRLHETLRIIAANVKRVEPIDDFAHERAHLIIVEV